MNKEQELLANETLEKICRQQYEEIEKKSIQIWDLEEENRVLRNESLAMKEVVDRHLIRIDELEKWCTHLQTNLDKEIKRNIPFRIARKIKRILIK